jgi:hypothetical protein
VPFSATLSRGEMCYVERAPSVMQGSSGSSRTWLRSLFATSDPPSGSIFATPDAAHVPESSGFSAGGPYLDMTQLFRPSAHPRNEAVA